MSYLFSLIANGFHKLLVWLLGLPSTIYHYVATHPGGPYHSQFWFFCGAFVVLVAVIGILLRYGQDSLELETSPSSPTTTKRTESKTAATTPAKPPVAALAVSSPPAMTTSTLKVPAVVPDTHEKALRVIQDAGMTEEGQADKEHAISMVDIVPKLDTLLSKFVEEYNLVHGLSLTGDLKKTPIRNRENREVVFAIEANKKRDVKIEVTLGRTDIKIVASWQKVSSKRSDGATPFGLEDMDAIEKHLWGLMRTVK